jgi:beta-lactam-binding protein with PASTA domain/predicted Ser/Thr protein kinase
MSVSDTLIDRVFDGRYRVVRKLGTGGMANVYLAEDQELGRRVAIKMLDDRHAQDEQFVERFRREAKNAAGLSHPNIVSIYDRGEAEGTYYIAMEYLEGRTLKELILSRGPTPIPVAIDYTRQILAGLAFAHRKGIVHRDIKPHNVVVGPDGRLKVTDFGIARSGTSQMTEAGSIIGTAQYLSPEQARGAPVDQRSDIYSVGIVLYEMLTGTVPFTGETPLEIAMKHLSATPEPPSVKRPDVPRALDLVVLRALAKDPEDRYETAAEMEADLARVARGAGVSSETEEAATAVLSGAGLAAAAPTQIVPRRPAPPPAYKPPPTGFYEYEEPIRRRPVWPWLLVLLLLVAAGFAGWYVYTKIQDQLNANKQVRVPYVVGIKEILADQKIRGSGLKPDPRRHPSDSVQAGYVISQDTAAGNKLPKGNALGFLVSSGKAKVTVPKVVGDQATDATAALASAKLKWRIVEVHSDQPSGTVTGQSLRAGSHVVEGTVVRINVSKGVAPVAVPPVIGQPVESAISALQGAGFAVGPPVQQDSNEPKGTVIGESPGGNTLQPKGSTITLTVSKGPTTTTVPDVTTFDQDTAKQTLRNSGFKVKVNKVDTTDQSQNGIVLSQMPDGNTQAKPGSMVMINVGKYKAPPAPPATTSPTDTTPATTAATTSPTP